MYGLLHNEGTLYRKTSIYVLSLFFRNTLATKIQRKYIILLYGQTFGHLPTQWKFVIRRPAKHSVQVHHRYIKKSRTERRCVLQICSYMYFFRTCSEISQPCHLRSDHQVTSSDLTLEKVWMLVITTTNNRSPWNIQILISNKPINTKA